jgi:hypothetical protein
MKKEFLIATFVALAGTAHAKKSCTDEPKGKWMSEETFKAKLVEQGYKIRKFKQPGTCFEIYGTNKDGKEVEIYFNPVDGSVVKEELR